MKNWFILSVIISGLVLGYGYWHSITHGSANIDLVFKASGMKTRGLLPLAEVIFMNENGDILAKGVSNKKYGHIQLINPDGTNCHTISKPLSNKGQKLWKDCINKQFAWIPKWIKDAKKVQVKHKNCQSKIIPLVISEHNTEWLLWWVPLPHVGGTPYSYFRASIVIEEKNCIK